MVLQDKKEVTMIEQNDAFRLAWHGRNEPFVASWNTTNAQLNPDTDSVLWNVGRKIMNFILYIPNSIVAACINPRSESEFYPESSNNHENYKRFTKKIITPDQVHLVTHVHLVESATLDTPTIILFNPLVANESVHAGLSAYLTQRKCNVLTFDYRGLGSTWRAEDFTVDGESVFIAFPVYLLGWEWEGSEALAQMQGDRCIIYHPNDWLIPFEASLASQCSPEETLSLHPDITGPSTHFNPITNHTTAEGLAAGSVIADFFLSQKKNQ